MPNAFIARMPKPSYSVEELIPRAAACVAKGIERREFVLSFEPVNRLRASMAWFKVTGQ